MEMLFGGWPPLVRTLVVGVLAYGALVLLLRVSGKRTLSKWNAFDLIVTIALGSSLSSAILSANTSLAQGALAFAVLIVLQLAITWLAVRSKRVRRIVKASPTLLLRDGRFLGEALRRERVTESEVCAALRAQGIASSEGVAAVVLETDGSFSVIRQIGPGSGATTMADVEGWPDGEGGS